MADKETQQPMTLLELHRRGELVGHEDPHDTVTINLADKA